MFGVQIVRKFIQIVYVRKCAFDHCSIVICVRILLFMRISISIRLFLTQTVNVTVERVLSLYIAYLFEKNVLPS